MDGKLVGSCDRSGAKVKAWYRITGGSQSWDAKAPVETLLLAGVALYAFDPDEPAGPGILFFDQCTQPLCELLRDVSRGGLERVLAVAVSRSALADGAAWLLLRHGASDVLAWDASDDPAAGIAARFERWSAVDRLVKSPLVQNNLVGRSSAWTSALRQIVATASFTDAALLITGESGTGKELVARLIHSLDPRQRKRDLVVLDCTTVTAELAGSEFFGHERGAFTGAVGPRDGAFALADGGTLFLDEIGELPLPLQAQLLRVIQEHTYKRVGGNVWQKTSFRLVCATNRPLTEDVECGRFRADLYYRIANVICRLPPLRDRPEDILPLFLHFVAQLRPGEDPPELDEPVRQYLLERGYPGNVRDLKQLAARIAYRHVGPGPVTTGDIPEDERPTGAEEAEARWWDADFETSIRRALSRGVGLKEIGQWASETAIRVAVGDAEGSLQRAAQRLGVTDRALQMRRAADRRDKPAARLRHTN